MLDARSVTIYSKNKHHWHRLHNLNSSSQCLMNPKFYCGWTVTWQIPQQMLSQSLDTIFSLALSWSDMKPARIPPMIPSPSNKTERYSATTRKREASDGFFFARQEPNAQGPKNSPPKCWPDRNPRITPENLSPLPSPPHPIAPARPPPPTLRDSPHSSGSCAGKSGPFLFSQPMLPLPPPPPHSGHPESATHHWPLLLAATV